MEKRRRHWFVYLAYVDDSGVTDQRCQFGVFAAVLVHDLDVILREQGVADILGALVGEDRFDEFYEFHARDLFRGESPFNEIPETRRYDAMHDLMIPFQEKFGTYVTYGAVDRYALKDTVLASLNPADVAFRKCVLGVESFLMEFDPREGAGWPEVGLLILDDTGDTKLKSTLIGTFRAMRRRSRPRPRSAAWDDCGDSVRGQLPHLHSDLYFGDSKHSVGLQMADMCAYFIGLHLRGDVKGERFYEMFEPQIRHPSVFPKSGLEL